jgi:hypothetical protein
MKRFLEREEFVVEMVAKLVAKRAQEALEGDDLPLLRRSHPDADRRAPSPLEGSYKPCSSP